MEELKLENSNNNIYNFQLLNTKTREILSEGNIDLSKDIILNNEISSIIRKNNNSQKIVSCKIEYPFLENKEIAYEDTEKNSKQFCRNKYTDPSSLVLHYDKYYDCIQGIKAC